MPRLSEPGPLGMRAEHWYDFGSLAGNSDLFVQVVAHIAAAAVPNSVLQYLRARQITPLAKPTGGHRPLLMMSFLRRLALKIESVAKCAGPLQYGVGRPDGANTMRQQPNLRTQIHSFALHQYYVLNSPNFNPPSPIK